MSVTSITGLAAPPVRRRSRRQLAGFAILLAIAAFAIFGPWLNVADPLKQDLRAVLIGPGEAGYLLGTDHLGRSMAARLAHAARLSLGFGVVTVLAAALPGVVLGLLAAWFGGWIDRILSAFCDAIMALPGLLLVLIVAAFAPGAFWPLFLGLALALWVEYFRLVRAIASRRLAAPDVEAAKLFGFTAAYVIRRHLLPELWSALATLMAFGFAAVIVAISTLSFIGIGMRPPTPEWGSMMTELLPYHMEAPLQVLMPAMCLFLTVLGLQLAADGDSR